MVIAGKTVLALPAADGGIPSHSIANPEAGHVRANLYHGAGPFVARDPGQLEKTRVQMWKGAGVDLDVRLADGRRMDFYQHFVGTGLGLRHVFNAHLMGTMNPCCQHGHLSYGNK